MVIRIFGLGLTLELLSQVMKIILVSLLFLIWKENLMDVFPLQRAIGFCQYGGFTGNSVKAGELCMTCVNTKLLPVISASGIQEQLVELTCSRLQSEAGKILNLTNVSSLWVI